jgi:DNA-binding CsgD family transcriptional regulator
MELTPEPPQTPSPEFLLPRLSMMERRVGSLVAAGYAEVEIARRLLLSPQLVEWTVAKLCRTFAVTSRDELAARLRDLSSS